MFILKEILNVRSQRICYCGRTLTGDFCELHGTDIRIDTHIVEFRIQFVGSVGNPLHIDIDLPKNQFLNLVNRNQFYRGTPSVNLIDVHYEVRFPLGIGKKLIEEFLTLSDFESFFGDKYLIQSERIKWKSVVYLYFLLSYTIHASQTAQDTECILLHFSVSPLRRVSDYITWRVNHCLADRENILWSLKHSHSSVFQSNGDLATIVDVSWKPTKRLPSDITIQPQPQVKSHKPSVLSRFSTHLFQGAEHFVLGQNQQFKAQMALEHIGSQFTEKFAQYIQSIIFTCSYQKVERKTKQFAHLIGLPVKLRYKALQRAGERQNQLLTPTHISQLGLDPFLSHPQSLLIISCSATKVNGQEQLPAILRYAGVTHCLLKALLLESMWPRNVDLLILSAKYGLTTPHQLIPYYDQRLKQDQINTVTDKVYSQLSQLDLSNYTECFINLSKVYIKPISKLLSSLKEQGCHLIHTKGETFHSRNVLMVEWLLHKSRNV